MWLPSGNILVSLTTTTSATQEDELGQLYLSNVDFLKNGVPASIVATFVSTLEEIHVPPLDLMAPYRSWLL